MLSFVLGCLLHGTVPRMWLGPTTPFKQLPRIPKFPCSVSHSFSRSVPEDWNTNVVPCGSHGDPWCPFKESQVLPTPVQKLQEKIFQQTKGRLLVSIFPITTYYTIIEQFLMVVLAAAVINTYTAAAAAKSLQSCPTLCSPIDGSPPGSAVPGILQARTLEWVAISFSNAWKWKVKMKSLSRVQLFATPWTAAYQAPPSMGFFQARVLEWVAIAFSD